MSIDEAMPSFRVAPRSPGHRGTTRSAKRKVGVAIVGLVAALTLVACAPPPSSTPGAGTAANRVIFWTKCSEVVGLTDAELDTWHSRGVSGFVCKVNFLYALGGSQNFSPDPSGPPAGSMYDLQRQIRNTGIVSRAAAHGITLWLGIGMSNYYNDKTPWAEWFDDATWTNTVLPNMRNFAGAARMLGFAGLAFDEELYAGKTGTPGDWDWNYPGNTHSELEVRGQARARGAQLMQAIASGFPNAEIVDTGWRLPEGWEELAQQVINGITNSNAPRVEINFWDGMTSVPGYGTIRFIDDAFHKFWHLPRSNWDIALNYNTNRLFSMFSRRLSNWSYASSRVQVSTIAWICQGPLTGFQDARSPDYVTAQVAAFRRWGTGDAFANYASSGLYGFDYTPYVPALQAAAAPGVVDTQPPVLTVQAKGRVAETALVSGIATDNMGIRSVRWRTDSGRSGAARMVWTVTSGDYAVGYQWRMDWLLGAVAAPGERITITAEDVRGVVTSALGRRVAPPRPRRLRRRQPDRSDQQLRSGDPPRTARCRA